EGEAGYALYGSDYKPSGPGDYRVPLSEIDGGNRVSYEDGFDLTPRTYYYTVVPKNGSEGSAYSTLEVKLERSLTLEQAQAIVPEAKAGDLVSLQVHPLGTDYLGRDMLARLMVGARVSLFIG